MKLSLSRGFLGLLVLGFVTPIFAQIDRNATYETRVLYYNLDLLSNQHLLFGHQLTNVRGKTWLDSTAGLDTSDVKGGVGAFPAVFGFDFSWGWQTLRRHVLAAIAHGGVITFSWHAMNPVTGGNFYDTEGRPIAEIIPGGSANKVFKHWLHQIADFANHLEVQGNLIPIIFRPFHENTGHWFWWGANHCSAEEFRAAWRYMVHYLRDTLQVHNFLYAYSPSGTANYGKRYPGDDFVDIIGFDLYEKDDYSDVLVRDCRAAVDFATQRGKIAAITETGVRNSLSQTTISDWFTSAFLNPIKQDPLARNVSWALFWSNASSDHYWVPTPGDPYFPAFLDFYHDPFTIFENNLPDMYTPIIEDKEPPVIVQAPQPHFLAFRPNVEIVVVTDERAEVRYSFTDQPYQLMPYTFSEGQGGVRHKVIFSGSHGNSYSLYVRAVDAFGNAMSHSLVITFTIDTTKTAVKWMDPGFDDSSWKIGRAPLGYGNSPPDSTVINDVHTVYFRTTFVLSDSVIGLGVLVKGHDGAVAYVNGIEIGRYQIAADKEVSYQTRADDPRPFAKVFVLNQQALAALRIGENLVAVEMHSFQETQPDLSFDGRVFNNQGIYLNLGSPWRYFDAGKEPEAQISDKTTTVHHNDRITPSISPCRIDLAQNYPNPFNSITEIRFTLPDSRFVEFAIFDAKGRLVRKLLSRYLSPGNHRIQFQAVNRPGGIYFGRLKAGNVTCCIKMLFLK